MPHGAKMAGEDPRISPSGRVQRQPRGPFFELRSGMDDTSNEALTEVGQVDGGVRLIVAALCLAMRTTTTFDKAEHAIQARAAFDTADAFLAEAKARGLSAYDIFIAPPG